jgi:hypothetical protein
MEVMHLAGRSLYSSLHRSSSTSPASHTIETCPKLPASCATHEMANTKLQQWPRPIQLGLDIASGRHTLSKAIPPLLWLLDAGLTSGIIWKIPCKLGSGTRSANGAKITILTAAM